MWFAGRPIGVRFRVRAAHCHVRHAAQELDHGEVNEQQDAYAEHGARLGVVPEDQVADRDSDSNEAQRPLGSGYKVRDGTGCEPGFVGSCTGSSEASVPKVPGPDRESRGPASQAAIATTNATTIMVLPETRRKLVS